MRSFRREQLFSWQLFVCTNWVWRGFSIAEFDCDKQVYQSEISADCISLCSQEQRIWLEHEQSNCVLKRGGEETGNLKLPSFTSIGTQTSVKSGCYGNNECSTYVHFPLRLCSKVKICVFGMMKSECPRETLFSRCWIHPITTGKQINQGRRMRTSLASARYRK